MSCFYQKILTVLHPLIASATNFSTIIKTTHFYRVTIPEAAYVQFALLTSWWWAECAWNM